MATPDELPYAVHQDLDCPQVTHVSVDLKRHPDVWFLLRSDAHHDNKKCVQEVEYRHLKEAIERQAGILDFGDCFCAMQGKYDKRSSRSQMREEHNGDDYLDRLVSQTVFDYRGFARNWVIFAEGNHEQSVVDRCGVHLSKRLVGEFQGLDSPVKFGAYQGWVHFHFSEGDHRCGGYKVRYTHGYGGGGPVTKDTIQLNRQLVFLEDVDMVISGHTHDKWHVKQVRERLDDKGKLRLRTVDCLKLGTYKDQFSEGSGWAVAKGMPPKPLGGWWLRFYRSGGDGWKRQILDADED
jgi:predicted phosphodiesterase